MLITLPQEIIIKKKKKKKMNNTCTTLKHVLILLYSITDSFFIGTIHEQYVLTFGMFFFFCDLWANYVHYFLYSTPKFAKIFGILLPYEFSIKDTWLVLYASDR